MNATSRRSRSAIARQPAIALTRIGSRVAAGHRIAIAITDAPAAIPQPAIRSGICDAGPGSETGRMYASSSEVVALAMHRADHRREQHHEGDDRHPDDRDPGRLRRQRAERDQPDAGDAEQRLGSDPITDRSGEVDQQQHRERAERGERGHQRVADHLGAQREHRRHDQRRPAGAAQRAVPRVVASQPVVHEPHRVRRPVDRLGRRLLWCGRSRSSVPLARGDPSGRVVRPGHEWSPADGRRRRADAQVRSSWSPRTQAM